MVQEIKKGVSLRTDKSFLMKKTFQIMREIMPLVIATMSNRVLHSIKKEAGAIY